MYKWEEHKTEAEQLMEALDYHIKKAKEENKLKEEKAKLVTKIV